MSVVRVRAILISITIAAIFLVVIIAAANLLSIQEAQLSSGKSVWEINLSNSDELVVSHPGAEEIWQEVNGSIFAVYQNITDVQDARTDSLGNIWWSNGGTLFGQISTPTQIVTTWQAPNSQKVWGLALDEQDQLWLSGWTEDDSSLFSFNLNSSQMCTYTLPTSTNSTYVVHDKGQLWLGSREADRLYRVAETITDAQVSWWQMPAGVDISPNGLVPDGAGNLWWADQQLGGIGFLDSSIDQLQFYTLPHGTKPQMVFIEEDWIWYTEITTDNAGTIGALNPGSAGHFTASLTTDSAMITPDCAPLASISSKQAITRTETVTWTAPSTVPLAYAQDGWWIYELAAEPYGLVERGGELFVTEQSNQKLLRMQLPRLGQLHLKVTTSISQVFHGNSLDYIYTITYTNRDGSAANNIQLTDDGCQPIGEPSGDSNKDGLLDVDETWRYTCTAAVGLHDDEETVVAGTVSTATVSGKDADSFQLESDTEITVVPLVHDKGDLTVEKGGPDEAAHGELISFDYTVRYSSQDDAPAVNVQLADDKCTGISSPDGDEDEDGRLDVDEEWTYSCQITAPDHVEGEENPWTNTASANANNFDGLAVKAAKAQHEIHFDHTIGRITLIKIGPEFREHGEEVTFEIILVFENEDRSAAKNVSVNDNKCGPVLLVRGDTNGDGKLNVGEFWLYRCKYVIPPHVPGEKNPIINTAVGSGKNEDNESVISGTDQHRLRIIEGKFYLPIMGG